MPFVLLLHRFATSRLFRIMACVLPNVGAFNLRLYRGRQTCRPFICTGRGIVHRWTPAHIPGEIPDRSEEHTSELQSLMPHLVCALLLEKKTKKYTRNIKHQKPIQKAPVITSYS